MTSNPNDGTKFSFTIGFHYSGGVASCEGPIMNTVVSEGIGAKYRVGLKSTNGEHPWSTHVGLEAPQPFDVISRVFSEKGGLRGTEFLFEVFDSEEVKIFGAEFDAMEKFPSDGFASDKMVATSFSYLFELPERLQPLAKAALERHKAGH